MDPGSIAELGAALSNPARVSMCLALLDGRAWTAGELARVGDVAKSTASEHLTALISTGLLAQERQGRHTYLRLASDAAHIVEAIAAFSGEPATVASFRAASTRDDLAKARTCYDHIAGALGVALYDSLLAHDALTDAQGLTLTPAGLELIATIIGPHALRAPSRRPLLRTCLDWTERRHHLAGHLGSALLDTMLDREWVLRTRTHRGLRLTAAGAAALRETFDIDPTAWISGDDPPNLTPSLRHAAE